MILKLYTTTWSITPSDTLSKIGHIYVGHFYDNSNTPVVS